jgi:hypothetical protein
LAKILIHQIRELFCKKLVVFITFFEAGALLIAVGLCNLANWRIFSAKAVISIGVIFVVIIPIVVLLAAGKRCCSLKTEKGRK